MTHIPEYLSTIEGDVLKELNSVRANPAMYAEHLKPMIGRFQDKEYKPPEKSFKVLTNEGAKAVEEAVAYLLSAPAAPPLDAPEGMCKAASDHVKDIGPQGLIQHNGTDGSTPYRRLNRYGRWRGAAGENICYYETSGRDIVVAMIVDDGVKTRGHRKNCMNPEYKVVGIACGPHKKTEICCVIDFAIGYELHQIENSTSSMSPIAAPAAEAAPNPSSLQLEPSASDSAPAAATDAPPDGPAQEGTATGAAVDEAQAALGNVSLQPSGDTPASAASQPAAEPGGGDDDGEQIAAEKLKNVPCCGCNEPLGLGMTVKLANGARFHEKCFACAHCHNELTGPFILQEEKPYCKECHTELFRPRCSSCGKPIVDKVLTALGAKWHKACFKCSLCGAELGGGTFYVHDKDPICANCT